MILMYILIKLDRKIVKIMKILILLLIFRFVMKKSVFQKDFKCIIIDFYTKLTYSNLFLIIITRYNSKYNRFLNYIFNDFHDF